jgi:hypothetical protein
MEESMKTLVKCLFISIFFVSCGIGTKSDILQLPWGIEYSRAKGIISKNGLTISEENSNQNDSENLKKYGARAFFTVDGKYGQDNAMYSIVFHSNKFAGGFIRLEYTDAQTLKLRTLELKDKLIKEYGVPRNETDYSIYWEKDNLFVTLFSMDLSSINSYSISLNYQNENYYNKEILKRYETIEDTWRISLYPKEYRVILSNGQMTNETYERDKLIETEGPNPYIISGNRITVVDKNGKAVVMEYILNRNTLKITMDGDEMEFSRVP